MYTMLLVHRAQLEVEDAIFTLVSNKVYLVIMR